MNVVEAIHEVARAMRTFAESTEQAMTRLRDRFKEVEVRLDVHDKALEGVKQAIDDLWADAAARKKQVEALQDRQAAWEEMMFKRISEIERVSVKKVDLSAPEKSSGMAIRRVMVNDRYCPACGNLIPLGVPRPIFAADGCQCGAIWEWR